MNAAIDGMTFFQAAERNTKPTEDEFHRELGAMTKDRNKWKESIPHASSLLNHYSEKNQAKAFWLLDERSFAYLQAVHGEAAQDIRSG